VVDDVNNDNELALIWAEVDHGDAAVLNETSENLWDRNPSENPFSVSLY